MERIISASFNLRRVLTELLQKRTDRTAKCVQYDMQPTTKLPTQAR